jgi:formyl-CoA transferase
MWDRLCEALERPDWQAKPEWRTPTGRSRDRQAINAAIGEVTRTQPAAHWISLLEEAGLPCGPIYTIDQVFADPQVKHLGMATPMGETHVVASAINMSGLPRAVRLPTPDAGAHTDEVLREVGYSDAEIAALREKGTV